MTFSPDAVLERMRLDKKAVGGKMRFILPTRLGHVELFDDIPEATSGRAESVTFSDPDARSVGSLRAVNFHASSRYILLKQTSAFET
jgi:hypothetical protein